MASVASTTPLNVCNKGLILVGADQMTSFDDSTIEASVATAMYEDIVRAALTGNRWRFATKQVALIANATDPVSRYDSAYTLPSDALMVNAVTVNDCQIEYNIYTNYVDGVNDDTIITCNSTSTETVVADYVCRRDEASWPPYFVLAVQFAMAHVFALSIARDSGMANAMEARSEVLFAKARLYDSQQHTTRKLATSRLITQRRS